ncbi:hypothetical protein SDC9_192769 [bioreactor metagenome]|uniref:Uncharacterized protein n=1 Tax=bioreactor metagenome TaxID=1076179 RepID=A0A645I349_9ZZZZ
MIRMYYVPYGHGIGFFFAVSHFFFPRPVDIDKTALCIHAKDQFGGVFNKFPVMSFSKTERFVHLITCEG